MSAILENIKRLVSSLTIEDKTLADQFIANRDFESLYDLVDSAILRVLKDRRKKTGLYENIDLDNLNQLRGEVAVYVEQLELPEQEEDFSDSIYL